MSEPMGPCPCCTQDRNASADRDAWKAKCAEACERDLRNISACATLTASLASMTEERDDYRCGAEVEAHAGDEARAELAELRKRMGEAEKALGEMLDKRDGEPDDCLHPKCGKGEVCAPCLRSGIEYRKIEEVLSLLASPPSPAAVEKMPMVVKVNPKACTVCGHGPSRHGMDTGACGSYCAPVESRPKFNADSYPPTGDNGCDRR